jgi:hypothetical protein
MALHRSSSILALFRSDAMPDFVTIKWRVSIGNRFWSSMIFCYHKMAQGRKRDELKGKASQNGKSVNVTPIYAREAIR